MTTIAALKGRIKRLRAQRPVQGGLDDLEVTFSAVEKEGDTYRVVKLLRPRQSTDPLEADWDEIPMDSPEGQRQLREPAPGAGLRINVQFVTGPHGEPVVEYIDPNGKRHELPPLLSSLRVDGAEDECSEVEQ